MTKFDMTPVIDIRAAGRDRLGTPGQSNFLTASARRKDNKKKKKLFSESAILVMSTLSLKGRVTPTDDRG